LIADLSGGDGKANLLAAVRLKSFGSKASPTLFKALAEKPPLAARLRLEDVLQTIGEYPIPPDALQRTRAIQLLEQIGSEQAARVLIRLAETSPPTTASLDAQAALERLQERPGAPKLKSPGNKE
jgi:HEAT repeat protein